MPIPTNATDPNRVVDCVFCNMDQSRYFWEGQGFYAIESLNPSTPGHSLVITKKHFSDWFAAPWLTQMLVNEALDAVKEILDEKYKPQGYNIGMNVGEASGQTIFHLHVHLIPRHYGDDPNWLIGRQGNKLNDKS